MIYYDTSLTAREATRLTQATRDGMDCRQVTGKVKVHVFDDGATTCRCGAQDQFGNSAVKTAATFTLAQLGEWVWEFLDDMQTGGHATVYGADSLTGWKFETFLQWIQKNKLKETANDEK